MSDKPETLLTKGYVHHTPAKRQITHQGPVLADPSTRHVIMAKIALSPGSAEYEVYAWCATGGGKVGFQTKTDLLIEGLWEVTLSVLNQMSIDPAKAVEDIKIAILTLAGEMDKKTGNNQRLMAELGSPTIRQEEPKNGK